MTDQNIKSLQLMVRGAYDLQALRMQMGLRLCANFRSRLKELLPEDPKLEDDGELGAAAIKVIDELKAEYRRLTDGVAKRRTIPDEKNFTGAQLISTYTELVLVDQYLAIEAQESKHFRAMTEVLEKIPIYETYLKHQRGIGPAMAGVIITYFDPHKARNISAFWKYAGLDVADDGRARSRRPEHLIDRVYVNKNGEEATRVSITYEPFLHTKLLGVLGPSLLRSASPWREVYDGYKRRIETDPAREKCTVVQWKKRRAAGEDVSKLWTPGRIHKASNRYMIKMLIADLWTHWRTLEGLPVTEPYNVAKQGARPHKAA